MICYIIPTFSEIDNSINVKSPSEMYHDILQEEKIGFKAIGIKKAADKLYMHTYLTLTLFMLFNIT